MQRSVQVRLKTKVGKVYVRCCDACRGVLMRVMATEKIRGCQDATVGVFIEIRNVLNSVSSGGTCLRVSTRATASQKRESRIRWIVEGVFGGSCHLAAVSAPVGAGHGERFGLGGATEHNAAGEDSRLSAIVVGHLGLGVVDKDLGGAGTFPARHLWLGRVGGSEGVDAPWVRENGGRGVGGAGR